MATVFVVTKGEYSDYGILAIFSTRELAESFAGKENSREGYDPYKAEIAEWPLDDARH